jgi:UPF0716 protein FxsA
MVILLLAALIVWPVAEIVLMVLVAQAIGFFWMLMMLFASTVAGLLILRNLGRTHWSRFREAVDRRQPPTREAFDGVMATTGAILLILPGFISSGIGLLMLLPPTRALFRALLLVLFARRYKVAVTAASWGASRFGPRRGAAYDFEGEAEEVGPEGRTPRSRSLPAPSSRPIESPPEYGEEES